MPRSFIARRVRARRSVRRAARRWAKRGGHRSRLLGIGAAYVATAVDTPGLFRAMYHPSLGPRIPGSELDLASKAAFAALVEAISEAVEADFLAGDPLALSLTAWALVHGIASLAVDGHFLRKGMTMAPKALSEAAIGQLLDGAQR